MEEKWSGIERRRNRMPPDNFTPNGAFEGYVYSKLETMEKRLDVLPCNEQSKRLGLCENKLSNIEGKATILGALGGFITYLAGKIFLGR